MRDLVLVGGGHAHVLVLEALARDPLQRLRTTLVSDASSSVYSGMVPGCVAGLYDPEQVLIQLGPLADAAGARLVVSRVVGMDPHERTVQCQDHPPIPYDFCSLDVGSTVRGLDLPGVRDHAIPTRPIAELVGRLRQREALLAGKPGPHRVAVVGGGPAGVELAFCLHARLLGRGLEPQITLLDRSEVVLVERGERTTAVVRREAARRGIVIESSASVTWVEAAGVQLQDGRRVPADLVVWATGAAAHPFSRDCGLSLDDHGFLRVGKTLQAPGFPEILGAGDCIAFETGGVPKAGVHAIRQGPVLVENIRRLLAGTPAIEYRPQADFLSLLATGDRQAIFSWKGFAAHGRWSWWLKDWIDRRFVERFSPVALPSGVRPLR